MDKKQAQLLIESTFNDSFNEEKYLNFARNLLNDIDISHGRNWSTYIYDDFKDKISKYKRVGLYTDPNGQELEVLIIEVKNNQLLERARTSLRNFIIKWLQSDTNKSKSRDFALVAFYSKEDAGIDWRFSFIKVEQSAFLDEEKGKVKLKKEFTPAKRYSFLVGKNEKTHTAQNQLLPLLQNITNNPTIEEIESAFSVEKVTDEFFSQYKDLYIKLYEHFENDEQVKAAIIRAEIDNTRFTKKLLGQIVFLYFLQKKGWLGVAQNERWGSGKKHFVQELFEQAKEEKVNFFRDKLQYLFYEALAKERDTSNSYYGRFNCRIPFLNGGLFEADYKWEEANITIPETIFRNEEKNKSGDTGTGVLDVFDRYNFTIKEDEPLDKEVAVDPEMLGKVFENMLDITERKSKGAFYTPREIVHYMCQESLIHYLDNSINSGVSSYQAIDSDQLTIFPGSTNKKGNFKIELEHGNQILVSKTDIEQFIREGHFAFENDERVATKGETKTYQYLLPESIRKNADIIDQKLSDIRICDPAIGSGAFPVGLLHELVNAMLVLKPHFSDDYLSKKLKGFNIPFKESYSESRYIYRLKRHVIQESIYGVDIDASAIDIARLRLWLSLVVDEDDLDPIETLPNLDYKIVVGNSLIGIPDGVTYNNEIRNELELLKKEFFSEINDVRKKELRALIDTKIKEQFTFLHPIVGYKIDFDFKLYFSEVWREKGGFDVVIGNPPYVQLQDKEKISSELLRLYELQKFETFIKSGDIYSLFYEKGLKLSTQNIGILSFITSNRFCFTNYGESTRKFLSNHNLLEIINLNKIEVFKEANVGTIVTIVENRSKTGVKLRAGEFNSYNVNASFIEQMFMQTGFIESSFYDSSQWGFYESDILNLRKKIIDKGTPLYKVNELTINRGITTGLNKVFLIPIEEAHSIFMQKRSYDILKLVFKGAEIKRWKCKEAKNYIFHTYTDVEINNYPEILEYLSGFKNDLKNVYEAKMSQKKWYELRKCSYYNSFEQRKIIWTRLSSINSFAISENGEYSIDSTSFATGSNLEYYCSILNSRIVYFYFKLGGVIWGKDGIKWFGDYFDRIPVLLPSDKTKNIFNIQYTYLKTLADKQGFETQFSYFEEIVDGIVLELYFPEELKSAGKEILKHLGDLKSITDEMSEEKKLAIIQSEYERLNAPDHPVRIAMETLEEVEEVRIIREALR